MCQSTPFRAPSSTPAEAQKQTVTNTVGGIERTLECKTSSIQDEFFVTHKTAVESCVRQYTGRATLPLKNVKPIPQGFPFILIAARSVSINGPHKRRETRAWTCFPSKKMNPFHGLHLQESFGGRRSRVIQCAYTRPNFSFFATVKFYIR